MGQIFTSDKSDKSDKPIITYPKIACGWYHTIFIIDNKVYACGHGYGKTLQKIDFPQDVTIEHIVCRGYQNIIASASKIYTWRSKSLIQFGNVTDESITEIVLPNNQMITSVTCGVNHMVIMTKIKCYVQGWNKWGQLGLGDLISRSSPEELILSGIISVCCGDYHTIILTDSGCYACGRNDYGQLGLGNLTPKINLPEKIDLEQIISVACGEYHTIALTKSNDCYGWGSNIYGQLGLKDNMNRNSPQKINLSNVISVYCGLSHTFAIVKNNQFNELYAWGKNTQAELGVGYYLNSFFPKKNLFEGSIHSVICGGSHTFIIASNGEVWTWGMGDDGQLALGNGMMYDTPMKLEFKKIDD